MKRIAAVVLLSLLFVACEGPEGPPCEMGPPGPQGEQGPRGVDGQDGRPANSLVQSDVCTGTAHLLSTVPITMRYERHMFSDGAVLTTCGAQLGTVEFGDTRMYHAQQVGARDGACLLYFDYDSGNSTTGGWVFTKTADATNVTIRYVDPPSPYHNSTFTAPCTRFP